jgi:Xaa-Pro aminopeptidase
VSAPSVSTTEKMTVDPVVSDLDEVPDLDRVPDLDGADALLIVGDSERLADLYYATGFMAPDPFVFLWTADAKIMMVGNLEVDRARSQAQVDEVVASAHIEARLKARGNDHPSSSQILLALLEERGIKRVKVPADFPLDTADSLRTAKLQLDVVQPPLLPRRQFKRPDEVEAVRRAMGASEAAMAAAVEAIAEAQVRAGVLYADGEVLTSERLRRLIHVTLIESDCVGQHTIAACGRQGCDPHQQGHGPLRAGETIIIDIFPRDSSSGYYGDITRTVVKGKASDAVIRLYDLVLQGQELALDAIADGVDGGEIHQSIQSLFAGAGYTTGEKDGHMEGFFHSTGHGLGLEIHEAPRIGPRSSRLRSGQVVTVEPGLYYPEVGGVRIEDVVLVTDDGCQNLTTFAKVLEV